MAQSFTKDAQDELKIVKKPCPQCLIVVEDEEQFLTCHGCFEDIHCLCFNDPINEDAYKILKEELSSVFIFCPPCKAKLFARNIFDKPESSDHENRLETLETQMSRLISILTESSSQTRRNVVSTVQSRSLPNHSVRKPTTVPINGTSVNAVKPLPSSTYHQGSALKLKSSSVKDKDFGLALSGHDQLKLANGQGNRSPLHLDKDVKTGSTRGNIRSTPPGASGKSFRSQPYPIPRISKYTVDSVKATEALKGCCFRKPSKDTGTEKESSK